MKERKRWQQQWKPYYQNLKMKLLIQFILQKIILNKLNDAIRNGFTFLGKC